VRSWVEDLTSAAELVLRHDFAERMGRPVDEMTVLD
jgi:hypothetical protein